MENPKPPRLYLLNSYSDDIRPTPASVDEIQDIVDGTSTSRLARVAIDDDGRIVAVPLEAPGIEQLRESIVERRRDTLRTALDAALALHRSVEGIRGIWVREALMIWPADAPWAEPIVRAWAAERGLTVHDESPPMRGEEWIRTMSVTVGRSSYDGIVKLQWPSVAIGEVAIAVEAMTIAIGRVGEDTAADDYAGGAF